MVNNRTFYAVKQLSVKNNNYQNNGFLTDALSFLASGVPGNSFASGATTIVFAPKNTIQEIPSVGQFITPSGEVFKYAGLQDTASYVSGVALTGLTRAFASTRPTAITSGDTIKWHGWEVVHGVQSVGVTTNFGLEQVFEFGQLEIYENIEAQPELEVTVERVLDGAKPMWFMVTDETKSTLNEAVANYRADIGLTIYSDAQNRASGTIRRFMFMSGMYISNATYTYTVDGNFTESITLVGNDKTWLQGANAPSGYWTNTNTGDGVELATDNNNGHPSGVQRRENFALSGSQLPTDLPGIPGAGVGNASSGIDEHLQTVTLSVDIGREDLFELGAKLPFFKSVTYPVEVSASFEVITSEGDLVEALTANESNLTNQTIKIRTDDGLLINLGSENKLLSIDFGGGDAGGGNDTVTYTYQTFNVFSVTHANTNYARKIGA
jgi:hypothetical protein